MKAHSKRVTWALIGVALAAMIGYAFVPRPVEVDVSQVDDELLARSNRERA